MKVFRFLSVSAGKAFVAKKPAEIPEHEQVILEPELEEALKNATDAEMCDIAGSDQTPPFLFPTFRSRYRRGYDQNTDSLQVQRNVSFLTWDYFQSVLRFRLRLPAMQG